MSSMNLIAMKTGTGPNHIRREKVIARRDYEQLTVFVYVC